MEKLYIDSNILLNVILEEELLVDSSYKLLCGIEKGVHPAVSSILTVMEIHRILQKCGKKELEIREAVERIAASGIEIIVPEREEMIAAYGLVRENRIDPADAIHLSVALSSAQVFVTRDRELSSKIRGLIKVKVPEEI